jgi:hypothetical protein
MCRNLTHLQIVSFLQALIEGAYVKDLAPIAASCDISVAELEAYLKAPSKRGAMVIPAETLSAVITAVQEWEYDNRWTKSIEWSIASGIGYYEAVDASVGHVLNHTVYSRALEVADKRLGSVIIHGNAPNLSTLDTFQSLRSRWRRALYSRTVDLDQVCAATGYDAHLVVCLGIEDIEMIHITGNPSTEAVAALEELVQQERMAA